VRSVSTGGDLAARTSAAIATGVEFLAQRQLPRGELRMMLWEPAAPEPLYDASIFGTACIAWSLVPVPGTERIRERAVDFIQAEVRPHGVWNHWTLDHATAHRMPPDLDDTAVACLALARNGRPVPDHRRLLLDNRDDRGLFFTWITTRLRWVPNATYWAISLSQFRRLLTQIIFFRITPSHRHDVDLVVNANVLLHLGLSPETAPVARHIIRTLEERNELSCDKWYDNLFSIWYFFSRALRMAAPEAGPMLVERVRGATPKTALERALAACALLDWNQDPGDEAIAAIVDAQLPTGAWPLAALYHGAHIRWGSEELSTGFCLEALSRWLGISTASTARDA
jgi:hypothetical protein